jgi:CheY-like chemotaxis protein
VVDDEPMIRALVATVLSRQGYTVLEAPDGPGALAVAAGQGAGIDLLLSDLMMPGMDGRELARRLLADRPGLRVLFISAFYTEIGGREWDDVTGQAAFLAKPFTPASLAAKVRDLLI